MHAIFSRRGIAVLGAALLCLPPALAAGGKSADPEQILRRMEESGALDRALDRAIERRVQREAEQRKQAAEEAQKKRAEMARKARPPDPARDHMFGPPAARISVIEYSDLECPYCKRFAGVSASAAGQFGDRVNVVWRHYPLEFHGPNARKEAYAAECVAKQAGNEGFFKFVNTLLKETQSNGKGHPQGDGGVMELARQAGVADLPAFTACLVDPEIARRVDADMEDGIAAGIEGTPGVILRDNATGRSEIVGGMIPQAALEQRLRRMLEAAGG